MKRYISFVVSNRLLVTFVIALITIASGYSISNGVIASSVIKLFFGESQKYTDYRALANEFGGTDVVVVAFEDEALLTPEGVARLTRVIDAIKAQSEVKSVASILDAADIRVEEDELLIEAYVERAKTGSTAAEVAAALRADPLSGGLLYSKTAPATAVLVELRADPDRPIEAVPAFLKAVRKAFHDEGYPPEALHLAGLVPESSEATEVAKRTILQIFPQAVVILALVVFILFLRIWPVIITGGVAIVSVIWTLGLAVAIDDQINLLMASVPGVITVIAFSDIIHLYSAFVREHQNGLSQHEAVLKSGTEVGRACLFTSITTFVGFVSLAFVPTPVMRMLGLVLGAGVGIALLLALTFVPVVLSILPMSQQGGESKKAAAVMDRIVAATQRLSLEYPKTVLACFLITTGLAAFGISQIQVDSSFARRLDGDNRVRRAQRFIDERFAASNFLDLYVKAEKGDLLDPKRVEQLASFEDAVARMPNVESAVSLVDLLRRLHREMQGGTHNGVLPRERDLIAQYLLLFEVSGGGGLERLINEERTIARMSVRIDVDGMRSNARIGNQAAAVGASIFGTGIEVVPTGITYLFGDWVTFILEGQRKGLLFAIIMTTIMMILCLRSLKVGLISMIPNLLPVTVLGGYVGLFWDVVDSDTMIVAMVGIGIAVDDTIHFLSRFEYESRATDDPFVALDRTFRFTGRAIVQTTIILCLGFFPFVQSEYFSTRILGTLLPLTLVVAVAADMLLVPALVKLGWLSFSPRRASMSEASPIT